MHLKSYAIDGRLLRTGSANWSPTGLKRQDNDVLYQSTPEAVEGFEREFQEMWEGPVTRVLLSRLLNCQMSKRSTGTSTWAAGNLGFDLIRQTAPFTIDFRDMLFRTEP